MKPSPGKRLHWFFAAVLVMSLRTPALRADAPAVRIIQGGRLTIYIGDDTSFQVQDNDIELGGPAFNPTGWGLGDTADAGTLVSLSGTVYGPNFPTHPHTNVVSVFTPWTPVSLSPVTGTGTAADPFQVVVVVDAGTSGLRLTETITHVAGSGQFLPQLTFSNAGTASLAFDAFLATDMFLSTGYVAPILRYGDPGGWGGEKVGAPSPACSPDPYYALLPKADRYTGHDAPTMWSEIASGNLSNSVEGGGGWCVGGGIATQWFGRSVDPGGTTTVGPALGVQFVEASPQAPAPVPTLDATGLIVAAAALGLLGWVLARSRFLDAR
jgi:hypothetical protein